ncbi:MAG: DUF4956 domain-containing protein [Solobacterium sp.]|nr:DUF4956 domain-containing protein [Solobacterium sp.]
MFSTVLTGTLTPATVFACILSALAAGMIVSLVYRLCEHPTKSFSMTVAILPAIVTMVIMMVNGNIGVGVAVAGSFSLVKFRSLPGKASDILVIFLAMALGLCTGMGYIFLAMIMAVTIAAVYLLLAKTNLLSQAGSYRSLRIMIPEDLDFTTVFDDIFKKYTAKAEVNTVKTMNLGTMYQISYDIELKDTAKEKEMIDQIRVRNGNLAVVSSRHATMTEEL